MMPTTPTVLIVEDDPVFRRVMSFAVASFDLRVESAADGQQGFDRLIQGGIDFLVTDLQMPICTGLQLIELLDASDAVQRPPTILCTAKGLELDTVDLIRSKDLVAIMHKPFSPRKLGELVMQQLREKGHIKTQPESAASPAELTGVPDFTVTSTNHPPGVAVDD